MLPRPLCTEYTGTHRGCHCRQPVFLNPGSDFRVNWNKEYNPGKFKPAGSTQLFLMQNLVKNQE